MTRADIETMLHELATTTRYLQENGRLMRETAEHLGEAADRIVTVNKRLQEMPDRRAVRCAECGRVLTPQQQATGIHWCNPETRRR
jgi:hypothetical protein